MASLDFCKLLLNASITGSATEKEEGNMNKGLVVEIAQFKLVAGVKDGDFLQEAEVVQKNFLEKQIGYIDWELLKGEDGQWVDILHWNSIEEAQKASEMLLKEPAAQGFIRKIDPTSIKMLHLMQLRKWK